MRKVIQPCPVCGNVDVEVGGSYRGVHRTFTGLNRVHCRRCGMVFAAPMPCEEDLNNYNSSYFTSAHGGIPTDSLATAFFSGIARLRMAHVESYIKSRNIDVSRVLEFGPGSGFFAHNWLDKHPQTTYIACETDTSCHSSLNSLGVQLISPSALEADCGLFDLLVMSHVVEHVTNPLEFVGYAARSLRKGGAIFIEVPCRDWQHKPIDEPHLLFFDKEAMHFLLDKLGFEDIHVSYHGQEIDRVSNASRLRAVFFFLRSKLIKSGLIAPFATTRPGMETVKIPLERAAIAPFLAHRETTKPAWWLRAVARKI